MEHKEIIELQKGDRHLVPAFLDLTKTVFPWSDFSSWYEHGFWPEEYIPHLIVEGGRIVSNVSITKMDLILNGEKKKGVQIGTVGTIPEHRQKGFSRRLMNHIIKKYENEADILFLFANETVLDFYPKFGFSRIFETLYLSDKTGTPERGKLKKLNWRNADDLKIIENSLRKRSPLTSVFGAENFHPISLWHIINVYPEDVYFCEELNVLVIFYLKNDRINVIDLAFSENTDMEKLISYISGISGGSSLCFHFPPDITGFDYDRRESGEDTMLFVKGDFNPEDGFKFPITSQT